MFNIAPQTHNKLSNMATKTHNLPQEEDTRTRAERTLKMLDDVFVETDIDKSGELDITEIQQMLNGSFSMDLSLEEVKEMVKEIDIDGNGLIDQRELRKAAKKAWVKDE